MYHNSTLFQRQGRGHVGSKKRRVFSNIVSDIEEFLNVSL